MNSPTYPAFALLRLCRQNYFSVLFIFISLLFHVGVWGQDTQEEKDQVVERFWQLLMKNPRYGTSFDRVYEWYADSGKLEELKSRCSQLTREQPQNAKYFLLSGMLAQRSQEDTSAQLCYDKAAQLDPKETLALVYLGNMYFMAGQLNEAATTYEQAINRKPNEDKVREIMLTLGRIYERLGEFDKAKANWSRFEQAFPNDRDIKLQIAETLEEEGRHEEALTRFIQLIDLAQNDDSNRVRFVLAAAEIKSRLGRRQEAVADFEHLLSELNSDSYLAETVRDRIEYLYINAADYAGLADYYKNILKNKPGQLETIRRLAIILVRQDRKKEARQLLTESIKKAPSNVPLRLACIDLLVEAKEYSAAANLYAEINKIDVNNPDHLIQWGLTLLNDPTKEESLRRSEAQNVWNDLLSGHEKDSSRYVMLANLLQENGMAEQAEPYYLKAVELSPNDPSYREYLGNYYHRQGNREKTIKALFPLVQGELRNAESLAQLAGIFESYGYHHESLSLWRDAAMEAPDDFDIQFQYASKLTDNIPGKRNEQSEPVMPDEKNIAAVDHQLNVAQKCATTTQQHHSVVKLTLRFDTELNRLSPKAEQLQAKIKTGPVAASDYWKLAMYYNALGQQEKAIRVLEEGLVKENSSILLLQFAAELYIQIGNDQKAAEALTRLADLDSSGRVESLRKLATIQRNMGQTKEAQKTAQAVLVSGTDNPDNIRFYADFLFSLGKTKDGLEILRRAARMNSSDDTSLSALANAFENANCYDEAIDVLWRLFDRSTELEHKISLTSRLAVLYQKTYQFEKLVARLRNDSKKLEQRRENTFCLAQAYISVHNYESARMTLESLLPQTERDRNADTLLLSQLATIAEKQGDLDRAIRYQQLLCDSTKKADDLEHLAFLLFQNGDKVQGQKVYLNALANKKDPNALIAFIDDILAQGEYELGARLMERLELNMSDDWEFLYRKAELLYWQGKKKEADAIFRKITSMPLDPSTCSAAEKERLKNHAQPLEKNNSPWNLNLDNKSETMSWQQNDDFDPIIVLAEHVLPKNVIKTLFRERLQWLGQGTGYSVSPYGSKTGPVRPLFIPLSFGHARNMSYLWQLKILFDEDHQDGSQPVPTENANWFKKLAEFKSRFPMDSLDVNTLDTRVWLETIPRLFYCIDHRTTSLPREPFGTSVQSVSRLAIKLGMLGLKSYRNYAIANIQTDLSLPFVIKNFDELRNNGKLDKILDQFVLPGNETKGLKKFVLNEFDQYRKQIMDANNDGLSVQDKINWLYEMAQDARSQINLLSKDAVLDQLKKTQDILRLYNVDKSVNLLFDQYKNVPDENNRFGMTSMSNSPDLLRSTQVYNPLRTALLSYNEFACDELMGIETEQTLHKFNEDLKTIESDIELLTQNQSLNLKNELTRLQQRLDHLMIDRLSFLEIPVRNYREIPVKSHVTTKSLTMAGMTFLLNDPWIKIKRKSPRPKITIDENDIAIMERAGDRILKLFRDYIRTGNRLALVEEQWNSGNSSYQSGKSFFATNMRYFTNSRNLSTYDLETLLGNSPQRHKESFVPILLQLGHRLDTFLKDTPVKENLPHTPFFVDQLKAEWNRMKEPEHQLSQRFIAEMDTKIASVSQNTVADSNVDIPQMTRQLEKEYKAAKASGQTMSENRLVLLALLYLQEGQYNEAAQCLDEINLVRSSDIKARELAQLNMALVNPEKMKPRLTKALERLSGYHLSENELVVMRKAYQLTHRDKEAEAIFDRLLLIASTPVNQYNLLNELDQRGDEKKNTGLVFSLKVYRSYHNALLSQHDLRSHCRNLALNLIKRYGKLDEVTSQLESQMTQSVRSHDLQMELVDTYIRSNRKEDAKIILRDMEKNLPSTPQVLLNYAHLCQWAGMNDQAITWSNNALKKQPELMFNNFWEVVQRYESNNRLPDLITILHGMKKELLARYINPVSIQLIIWANNSQTQPLIKELWNDLCHMEPASNINPQQIRHRICTQLSMTRNPFFEPVLKQHVFESLFPSDQNQLPNMLPRNNQIHRLVTWSDSEAGTISKTLIDCSDDLDTLQKELREQMIPLKNKTDASAVRLFTDATVLDMMIDLKKGHFKNVLTEVDRLEKDKFAMTAWNLDKTCFALSLSAVDDHDCLLKAVELLKQTLSLDSSRNYRNILFNRLCKLYLQLNKKEERRHTLLSHIGDNESWALAPVLIDMIGQPLNLINDDTNLYGNPLNGSADLKAASAQWQWPTVRETGLNHIRSKKQSSERNKNKNNDRFPGLRIERVERLWEGSKSNDGRK